MIAALFLLALSSAEARPRPAPAPAPPVGTETPATTSSAAPAKPAEARERAPIPDVERLTAGIVVQVDDRDTAQNKIISEAERLGGWFSALGAENVTLRVPAPKLPELVEAARGLGFVVDRSLQREALGAALADSRAAVAARREVLARYYEVLGTAGPDSVVAVESEIDRVIREIESYEGRIRAMEDRAKFAQLDVAFRFRDRSAPAPSGRSSFAWINEVDLGQLLGEFRAGGVSGQSCGARPTAPTGFAPFPRRKAFAAVSPDDVLFRVRTMKNKPRADLDFWTEALRKRLLDAGYRLTEEGKIPSAGPEGRYLELVAPDGERDARWIVALFVEGGQITVAEAAGEAAKFTGRREAVLQALRALKP